MTASRAVEALAGLIAGLSVPGAFPFPVDRLEVHQTHISVVFVAGPYAYEVKKPAALNFVDSGSWPSRPA